MKTQPQWTRLRKSVLQAKIIYTDQDVITAVGPKQDF